MGQYFSGLATTTLMVSVLTGVLLLITRRYHSKFSLDPLQGVQKVHSEPTPRVGGIALYLAVIAAFLVADLLGLRVAPVLLLLLVASFPCWFLGTVEDMTKRVNPGWRMLATLASGLLACWMSGMSISHLGIPGVDLLLEILPVSVMFTVFAVAGMTNAVNLIDGMNGLASGFTCVAFTALGFIAFFEGDFVLVRLCIVMGAAALGFMLLNWPYGRIFLGDGGSYFVGFSVAWTSVMVLHRHENVSAFSLLTICIHPVFETLYSIFRRWARGQSYATADRLHLHSLFLRRMVRNSQSSLNLFLTAVTGRNLSNSESWVSNAAGGLLLTGLSVPAAFVGFWWRHDLLMSVIVCLVMVLGYLTLYARLVRFHWCSPLALLWARPVRRVMEMRRQRKFDKHQD
jgi:UDP-N-acetylmuramyl pentapeptide phosphotransferase/UDP-N-acetylglucosamine-1-phosphate transferase